MNECIDNARTFYSLTFDPPFAAHADEYHSLRVDLNRPTLTAHTSTGYYDQPFYDDSANSGIHRLTVAQLEKIVQTVRGASAVRDLSAVVLTDRLSDVKLQSLLVGLRDKKVRESFEMIAAESTFLSQPSEVKSVDPPPSPLINSECYRPPPIIWAAQFPGCPIFLRPCNELLPRSGCLPRTQHN
jgi:hypothetical protein